MSRLTASILRRMRRKDASANRGGTSPWNSAVRRSNLGVNVRKKLLTSLKFRGFRFAWIALASERANRQKRTPARRNCAGESGGSRVVRAAGRAAGRAAERRHSNCDQDQAADHDGHKQAE